MAKYHQRNQVSEEVVGEAMKIAKGTQKPGQSKEQTKLIAQGIQKGIEQYKKQHKLKVREQDRQRKKRRAEVGQPPLKDDQAADNRETVSWIPWLLLILSWLGFAVFEWLSA